MAKGDIVIPISSETKAFKQGVDAGIIAPLDDAERALEHLGRSTGLTDVGRDADDLGDKLDDLGRSRGPEELRRNVDKAGDSLDDLGRDSRDAGDDIEDAMREAQTATDRLGDETKRTADAIEQDFRQSYRKVRDAGDDSFDKVKHASSEAGSELRQNLGESLSSFRGDLSDLPQIAQDTLGGLAGSGALGGIAGVAATAAGAAGIGLIGAAIDGIQKHAEEMKEKVSDAFQEMASNGVEAWESVESQIKRLSDAYDEHEGEIQKIADLIGVDFDTVAKAWAGNADAVATVNAAYAEQLETLRNVPGASTEATDATRRGWEGIMGPLNDTLEAYDTAKSKARALEASQSQLWLDAISKTKDAAVEVDKFGNKLVELPDGQKILIEASTGKATANVDKFAGDVDDKIDHLNGRQIVLNARIGHIDDSAVRRYHGSVSVPAVLRVRNPIID